MTLEELRLRIHAVFPGDEVIEDVAPEGSVRFEVNPSRDPDRVVVFWDAGAFWVWRARAHLERSLVSEIMAVSAHALIAARRRLALEELARLDADLIMTEPAPDAAYAD